MSMAIFLTNLGKYNEGYLIGKWVKLPIPADKLRETLTEIGINKEYEEYFITDYETAFVGMRDIISEFTSITVLNELAKRLESLSENEREKLEAVMESEWVSCVGEVEELIEHLEDFDLLPEVRNDSDLGYYYAEECGCIAIPEYIKHYFDYEAYGRDIRLDGGIITYTTYGCVIDNR